MKRLGFLVLGLVCSLSFGIDDRDRLFRMVSRDGQNQVASCIIYRNGLELSAVRTQDLGGLQVSERRVLEVSKGDAERVAEALRSQSPREEMVHQMTTGAVVYQLEVRGKWVTFHEEGAGLNRKNSSAESKTVRALLQSACR